MNNQLGKTLAEIFCDKYIIPLYQRNFAWRIEEVQQLLQDVYDAFKKNPKGNYYIGSLVVLKRHNGDYEVIDGQQRLTVISMIAILLGCKELARPVLSYGSRPEVQEFFETLCKKADEAMRLTHASLYYLKEAYTHILHSRVENWGHKNSESFLGVDGISNFFLNHVILVRNEIPDDTDVAAYFEIMNNRGEQLQKHELVKAGMLDRIKTQDGGAYDLGKQQQFASVWDACSQMGTPIQRLFSVEERKGYFGEQYDGFLFVENNTGERLQGKRSYSISEILGDDISASDCEQCSDTGDETETDVYEYDSIIDFPNFLMHVLRLYLNKYGDIPNGGDEIPLNEKELLSVYDEYADKIDPMKFIRLLLFCRTVFDRFVVKSTNDTHDQDDGKKWMLIKPKKKKNATCWNFVASFDKRVVKAISMLQVTSRSKIYKNWLFETLSWLFHECYESGNLSSVSSARYLSFIHDYMLKYYDEQHLNIKRLCDGENPTPKNSYSMGTETPHFLLNFIDYLYWCKFIKEGQPKIRDFDFKYWNTVEHHLARNKVDDDCPYINNLGNLCLVSKSSNSRLSDRDVKEKVEVYGHGNLGPNRQIIYSITKESLWVWGEDQIRTHYNELVELLDKRVSLLKSVIEDVDDQIEQLGGFITRNFFDCTLPNGYELTVAEGEDAESQNEWCGRYFHLSKSNGETIKCWVGWRYGGTDKVAYGRQIDFSAEPSFAIQVPVEGFGVPGDSWYKTIWVGKWWNKELSFDIHNRNFWVKTVEEFKAEVLRLCEVLP